MNDYRVCTLLSGYKSGPAIEFKATEKTVEQTAIKKLNKLTDNNIIGYYIEIKVLSKRAKLGYVWKPIIKK